MPMTATADKVSLKNKHLRYADYFAIIAFCLHFILLTKFRYRWTGRSAIELDIENEKFAVG